jgi:hypothetical protein
MKIEISQTASNGITGGGASHDIHEIGGTVGADDHPASARARGY